MKPTKEEVVDCMFMILHLDLALDKMRNISNYSYFWSQSLKNKGNTFYEEAERKLSKFLEKDVDVLNQFIELKKQFRDLNFQAIELLNKTYEKDKEYELQRHNGSKN